MMLSPEERRQTALRQQFVSDVFHRLGQPLTELQVSLELSLLKELDAAGYRTTLKQALDATQRVIHSAKFVRQLVEAEDPGASADVIDFSAAAREAIEEFEPLADSRRVEIGHIVDDGLSVWGDAQRLKRALFLVMDHCLHAALPGTRMHVVVRACEDHVAAEVSTCAQELLWRGHDEPRLYTAPDSMHRTLQLAERMFVAVGGALAETRDSSGARVQMQLPIESGTYRQIDTRTLAS